MAGDANDEHDKARRFRDAALPYLDDVFTLARYLMRNAADAEDAAQECYLRALRHFDSYRGPAMKPWLLTILRNVCNAEFARRGNRETLSDLARTNLLRKKCRSGKSRKRRRKPPCSVGTMTTKFASWSPDCRRSFARSLSCAKSTICPIRRSPKSPACRLEP